MQTGKEYDVISGINQLRQSMKGKDRPILIIIAGGTCSGKTFFSLRAKTVIEKFGETATIISLDDYFKDIADLDFPKDDAGDFLFDIPESYYLNEFKAAVAGLMSGRGIFSPEYDLNTNERLSNYGQYRRAGPVIIAEGVYTIAALRSILSAISVYMHADENIVLERRIERDTRRYRVSEETVRRLFERKVKPYYEQFVKPQKGHTDIVIKSQ